MNAGSLDELVQKCIGDLESAGLAVPGAPREPADAEAPRPRPRPRPSAVAGRFSGLRVPVGVSARHVHLCETDFHVLFGAGAVRAGLSKLRDLSQPGQFAAREVVSLVGPRGLLHSVRVLGPLRPRTQVEVSRTDARALGISPPVRDSGELDGSAAVVLIGPAGSASLREGAIIAARHIHMAPQDAATWGLGDRDRVEVEVAGERGLVLGRVLIRVHSEFSLELHLDTDEANAAMLNDGDQVEVIARAEKTG